MNTSKTNSKMRPTGSSWLAMALIFVSVLFAPRAEGQTSQSAHAPDALHQLNDSVEALVQRVSPSVVQIVVSGYSSTEGTDQGQMSVVIGKERTIGSGVIVDSEGYIVTNAHVVKGAEKIEVIVPAPSVAEKTPDTIQANREQTYDARIIGLARQLDLAVIKIEAHKLSALPIHKAVSPRQGEMVFAFGSPEGLRNSVTMGVVSAISRQPDPDSPWFTFKPTRPSIRATAEGRWWMRTANWWESTHSSCPDRAAIKV